ncbi:MAG TPA: hypothetical protein VKG20_19305, partial [Methylomirabilota bacterium]|nr:hypothetical protein [Methylomirabilota bacterium]
DHEAWNRSVRSIPATYGQAFLAVEYLIGRSSHAALVKFMGSAVAADNPQDRWVAAFSIPSSQFMDDFRAHLKGLARPAPGPAAAPKPTP